MLHIGSTLSCSTVSEIEFHSQQHPLPSSSKKVEVLTPVRSTYLLMNCLVNLNDSLKGIDKSYLASVKALIACSIQLQSAISLFISMCAVLECTFGVLCAGDSAYSAARSYFDEQFEEPEELSTDSDNDYTVFCWGQHTVVLTRILEGEDTTHSATASHILGIFPDISFFLVLAASGSEKPIVGETPLIIEKTVGIITSRDNRADVSENVERTVRILDATHLAPPHLLKNGFAILDLLQMKGMTLDELRRRFQTIFKLFLPRSKPRKPRVARPIADVPAQLSGSEEDKDMEKESRSVSQNGSGREDMGEKEKDEEDGSSQEMGELITGSATGISRYVFKRAPNALHNKRPEN